MLTHSQCQVMHHDYKGDQCASATILYFAHESGTKQDQVSPPQIQQPSMVPLALRVGHEGLSSTFVACEHAYQCLVSLKDGLDAVPGTPSGAVWQVQSLKSPENTVTLYRQLMSRSGRMLSKNLLPKAPLHPWAWPEN